MIAIVEDEPELQVLYRYMLVAKGYTIAFVSAEADEAVNCYAGSTQKPDLVIMDRRLKNSSGVDAACRIAALDPGARILFATADADALLENEVPGTVGVLQKPFAINTLFTAIERALAPEEKGRCQRHQVPSTV